MNIETRCIVMKCSLAKEHINYIQVNTGAIEYTKKYFFK